MEYKDSKDILFICACGNPEHQMIMRYWEDDKSDPTVYVSVHLSTHGGFFKRLWNVVRYLFGHKSIYGDFDEFIFKAADQQKLQEVADYLKTEISE